MKPGAKKAGAAKPKLVIEDDIPIPQLVTEPQDDKEADRSISIYPATVSSLKQEFRPPTPGIEEIKEKLKVNYDDFGFRIEEKMRDHLKTVEVEIETKERHSFELGQEIQTRKRLLAAVQAASGQADDSFFQTQILARDRQILILSDRLFDLQAKLKSKPGDDLKSKDQIISALQQQTEALTTMLQGHEQVISEQEIRYNAESRLWKEEKDQMSLLQEGLQEELEAAKLTISQKDQLLKESKSDLGQLATIIQDMTGINKELNQKMGQLNKDMEVLNTENFQSKAKGDIVEQLEASLRDLMTNKMMYEKQFEKLNQAAGNAEAEKEKGRATIEGMKRACTELSQAVRLQVEAISSKSKAQGIDESLRTELVQAKSKLEEVSAGLEGLVKDSGHMYKDAASGGSDVQSQLTELKVQNKEQTLQIEELKRSIVILESFKSMSTARIQTLETDMGKRREEFTKAMEKREQEVRQMKDQVDALKQQMAKLTDQRNDLELMLSKAQTQMTVQAEKFESFKSVQETAISKLKLSDQQSKLLKAQLIQLHKDRTQKEKELTYKDQTLRQQVQKMKAMELELWNKDSDLLARDTKVIDLGKEIETLEKELDQSNARIRTIIAEKLAEAHRTIDEKEHEIALLKGMLRSLQTQVKQKDLDLGRYKRKTGELASEPYSPKKASDILTPKSAVIGETELKESISTFCSQVDRMKKFSAAKLERIASAEMQGTLTPAWLKEELKLAKLPSESTAPKDLLKLSIEHRVNALLTQVQTAVDGIGMSAGLERVMKSVLSELPGMVQGEDAGLVESLRRYSTQVLFG